MIQEKFKKLFDEYTESAGKKGLTYVITSTNRKGNAASNPHALPGNAMDLTLRVRGEYAPIKEYNALIVYMLSHWPYRAGLDNTPHQTKPGKSGNVHVHVDLGQNRKKGQAMPYFFIEDNEVFLRQVKSEADL